MKRIIIVHRWAGGPNDDWRLWLKKELEKLGFEVLVPEMPDSDVPEIKKWVGKLAEVIGEPDSNTFFIGHSMGCQTILRYLETIDTKVAGAVFVSGWFDLENLEDKETKKIAKPWIETPIDLSKVKQVLPKSTLIISDNDPYGAFEENKKKFTELGSKIIVLHNAGHFTEGDGFTELPKVLKEIKEFTK